MSQRYLAPLLGRLRFEEEYTDRELLECYLADRDERAFTALLKRHGGRVLATCRRVLHHEADVEDAFQATFLILLNRARSVRWEASVGGWLTAVAHRVAVRTRARAALRQGREVQSEHHDPAAKEGEELLWREACAILHEELDRLPDAFRRPLVLCYIEGLTRDEAAQSLGCSLDTVKGRLERGRARLRGRLERRGVSFSAGLLGVLGAGAAGGTAAQAAVGSPSRELLQATARAATTGQTSARVAALVRGVGSMMHSNLRLAALALLAVSLVSGAGLWLFGAPPRAEDPPGAAKVEAAAKGEKANSVEVSGTVLMPDGKPCANAVLYSPHLKKTPPTSPDDIAMEKVGVTGPDGKFRVTALIIDPLGRTFVVAHAPGYGIEFVDRDKSSKNEPVTLKLPPDLPITGRLVNTEGKPVAGARVMVAGVQVPKEESLDTYLNAWKKNWRDALSFGMRAAFLPAEFGTSSTVSDKDGRFRLSGAGKERVVLLQIQGDGVAQAMPYVITRPGFDPKPYNEAAAAQVSPGLPGRNNQPVLYGPDFTFVVVTGRIVEGVIKEAGSGKPIAGASLMVGTGYGEGILALSDRDGKYQLKGVPPGKQYQVFVNPPQNSGYLRRSVSVEAKPGNESVQLDAELVKGVVVTGRVIDRETGKGIQSGIRFAPLPKNEYFLKPGYDGYRGDRTMITTDSQGRFRTTTIPGQSLLMVQAHAHDHLDGVDLSPYKTAVPDPDHKDLFQKNDDSWMFNSAGGLEFLSLENVVKVVDLKVEGENKVEVFVERGKTTSLVLQDEQGKPLEGVVASGMAQTWPITLKLTGSRATVVALDPATPRRVVFLHPEQKLGGSVTVRGDEKEPVVVRLRPLGTITGRFVDLDGNPLAGAVITPWSGDGAISELYRFLERGLPDTKTDKDGRFSLGYVIPGIDIGVQTRKGDAYYGGEPKIGEHKVEPGKTLDLGERKLKRVL